MTQTTTQKINKWQRNIKSANRLVTTFGRTVSDSIDAVAEFGAFIPLAEIVVTISVFYSAGLGARYGIEVLIGLVFAQVAALYLTAHYRDEPMHLLGQSAIFTSIIVGAVNTAVAIYLATALNGVESWVWRVPAFSSGAAVLFMYTAKMFTHQRVSSRKQMAAIAANEIRELNRAADNDHAQAAMRDSMQQTRLSMEDAALSSLAADARIQEIQKKAMYTTLVKSIMDSYEIHANSRLGKELLALAHEAVHGVGTNRPAFSDEELQEITNFLNQHDMTVRDFLSNGAGH